MDKRVDLLFGILLVALGVSAFVLASQFRRGTVADPLGVAGLPRALAVTLAFAGAAVVVRRLATWRESAGWLVAPEGASDDASYPASAWRPYVVIGALSAYVVAFQHVGYPITTIAFLMFTMWLMRIRSWWRLIGVSVGFTAVAFLLATRVFHILLPVGPLSAFGLR